MAIPEAPNLISVLLSQLPHGVLHDFLHAWENVIFAWGIALALAAGLTWLARRPTLIPRRGQNFSEWIVESFESALTADLGGHTRRFLPFLGTLFLYILALNWAVLFPGLKSPTGGLVLSGPRIVSGGFIITASLAISVFLYVQYTALRSNGLVGYVHHLFGSPRTPSEWILCLVTLAPVTHVLGELVRPISLALRLFGNVTGDDILFGVFFILGGLAVQALHLPVGIPLQILIVPLVLLFGFVQAMIFTWLTSAYLKLSLPYDEHVEAHQQTGGV